MKIARWFSLFVILLCPVIASAQGAPKDPKDAEAAAAATKEKQRKLTVIVDLIIADIPNFRLGVNRAILYAKAGSLICKSDPTRSAELLRTSVGELLGAQMVAETEKKTNPPNELLTGQVTRPNVLTTIARCDGDLALQSFYKTRPAAIERALAGTPEKPT